jgi:hypothetical protein
MVKTMFDLLLCVLVLAVAVAGGVAWEVCG